MREKGFSLIQNETDVPIEEYLQIPILRRARRFLLTQRLDTRSSDIRQKTAFPHP